MKQRGGFTGLFGLSGMVALLVGLMVRVQVVTTVPGHLMTDSVFYDTSARAIADGLGFSRQTKDGREPIYSYTPGYPMILAGFYMLWPHTEPLAETALRVVRMTSVQILLELAGVFGFGWAMGGMVLTKQQLKGYLWLLILYLPMVWYANQLLSEVWVWFFLAISLVLIVIGQRKSGKWHGLIGLVTGWLVLLKPYMVYIPVMYGLWLYGDEINTRRKWQRVKWFLGGFVFVVGVWLARTYLLTHRAVPLQAGLAYVTQTGACPEGLCEKQVTSEQTQHDSVRVQPLSERVVKGMWWYGVKKQREMWGVPEGVDLLASGDAKDCLWCMGGWTWDWHMGVWVGAILGILVLWRSNKWWRLLILFWVGAVAVHTWLWTQTRYAMVVAPILAAIASGGVSFWWQNRKVESARLRWLKTAAVIIFVEGLIIWLSVPTEIYVTVIDGINCLLLIGLGYSYYRLLEATGWRGRVAAAGLSLLLVGITVALLPIYVQRFNPAFDWAAVPVPYVLRMSGHSIY